VSAFDTGDPGVRAICERLLGRVQETRPGGRRREQEVDPREDRRGVRGRPSADEPADRNIVSAAPIADARVTRSDHFQHRGHHNVVALSTPRDIGCAADGLVEVRAYELGS
jgi:hypothetical protein